ncbi:MAG: hypothetical protein JKX70_02170 [Phycisphaerales bacterium]|nr:hypothetical protein [Phycisphaerales bacterium]
MYLQYLQFHDSQRVSALRTLARHLVVGAGAIAIGAGIASARAEVADGFSGVSPDPVVASHLRRSALLDLGLQMTPSPADYRLASALLSIASDLDPTNADIARSVVESAWLAGDQETMIWATRRVIKNDPLDTVAQLRLVSSIINEKQTVEGRLALYNRFLDGGGSSLDVSVRSRLALDAALLERDFGNERGFVERLHLATTLDMSNKSAASLAAQFYSGVTSDPVTQLEYQFKLLFADPLDPNVHLTIMRVLAREGAYVSARRFLQNAIDIYMLDLGRLPPMIEEIRLTLDWQLDGPQSVLDQLNPTLIELRASAQANIDFYTENSFPTDGLRRPEQILYSIGVDQIRLLAAFHIADEEMTKWILQDIQQTVNNEFTAMSQQLNQRGVNREALLNQGAAKIADFQVMRAIVGIDTDKIRPDLKRIVGEVPVLVSFFEQIEPMALYAEGNIEQALGLITKFQYSPVLEIIRGLSYEQLGETRKAGEVYTVLTHSNPLNAYGAFGRSRMIHLGYGDQVLTDAGVRMNQMVKTMPEWIDQMDTRPETYVYLGMELSSNRLGTLDRPMITIRLKNLSPIPLALGPASPMDSRFLITPRIDDSLKGFQGKVNSKVVDLGQRLRLRPLEEIVVEVPADSPQTAWLLKMQPNASIRQRWRVIQGFQPRTTEQELQRQRDQNQMNFGIVASPFGLSSQSEIAQRLVLGECSLPMNDLVAILSDTDEDARRRAVIASAAKLTLPADGMELSTPEKNELIGGLIDLYTRAQSPERARMILLLPHRHQVAEMIAFDDHVIGSILSEALIDSRVDTVLLASALLTRTDASDSPIFEVLEQSSDPRVHTIAGIIKARLDAGSSTLGMIGPGVESMIPAKENFDF